MIWAKLQSELSQHSSKCFNCMCTPYFKTTVMYSRQQTYCIYNEMKAALDHTLEQNQAWLLSNPQEPSVNTLLNYSEFCLLCSSSSRNVCMAIVIINDPISMLNSKEIKKERQKRKRMYFIRLYQSALFAFSWQKLFRNKYQSSKITLLVLFDSVSKHSSEYKKFQ